MTILAQFNDCHYYKDARSLVQKKSSAMSVDEVAMDRYIWHHCWLCRIKPTKPQDSKTDLKTKDKKQEKHMLFFWATEWAVGMFGQCLSCCDWRENQIELQKKTGNQQDTNDTKKQPSP